MQWEEYVAKVSALDGEPFHCNDQILQRLLQGVEPKPVEA